MHEGFDLVQRLEEWLHLFEVLRSDELGENVI